MRSERELEALVLRLPRARRARLARRLIDSLDEEGAEVARAWTDEAAGRDEDIQLERAAPIPATEVVADARSTSGETVPTRLHSYVPGQRVYLSGSVMLDRSEYELENVPATVARVDAFGVGCLPDADAAPAVLIDHLHAVEEWEGLIWWAPNVDGHSMLHVTPAPLPG